MNQISGTVVSITPQHGVSRNSGKPYTIWTAQIDNQVVKCGFRQPTFQVGQHVTVEVQQNKYGDMEIVQPGQRMSGGAPAPRPQAPRPQGGSQVPGNSKPFPLPNTHGDNSIIRQNALAHAVKLYETFISTRPAAHTSKLELDDMMSAVVDMAYTFAEFSSGQREVRIAEGQHE